MSGSSPWEQDVGREVDIALRRQQRHTAQLESKVEGNEEALAQEGKRRGSPPPTNTHTHAHTHVRSLELLRGPSPELYAWSIRSSSNHTRVFRRLSNHIRVFRRSSNQVRAFRRSSNHVRVFALDLKEARAQLRYTHAVCYARCIRVSRW